MKKMVKFNGSSKSAFLLMSIGTDVAGQVLKYLKEQEIKKIVRKMLSIKEIPANILYDIFLDIRMFIKKSNRFSVQNKEYVFLILKKVMGEKKSTSLLDDVLAKSSLLSKINKLNQISSKKIFYFIKYQKIEVICVILIYLSFEKSIDILRFFNLDQKVEIVSKMAFFSKINKIGLIELKKIVKNLLKKKKKTDRFLIGIKKVVKVLYFLKTTEITDVLENIEKNNKILGRYVKKYFFSFQNIYLFDNFYIKKIISYFPIRDIAISIQSSSDKIKNKFKSNFSKVRLNCIEKFLKNNSFSRSKKNDIRKNIMKKMKFFFEEEKLGK